MLTGVERDTLIRHLAERIAYEQDMRGWLLAYVASTEFAIQLPRKDDAWAYAAAAVDLALDAGEDFQPPWIDALLRGVVATAQLAEISRKLARQRRSLGAADPFGVRRLHHGLPFLDRQNLRVQIQTNVFPSHRNVLVVNGPKESGKSYTGDYIEHLCRLPVQDLPVPEGPPFRHVPLWIEPDEGSTYGPEDLAVDLVSGMERPSTPPPESGAHRLRQLSNWIFDEAAATQRRWFWVFDGFCTPDLNERTRTLLHRVVRRAAEGTAAERVRIALIDYPADLPEKVADRAVIETFGPPSAIGELDVREYFGGFREGLRDDEEFEHVIAQVMSGLPSDAGRLSELARRMARLTGALEARRAGAEDNGE